MWYYASCMKRIALYRHSTKTQPGDADLSPEGIALAKTVGASLRGKGFTHLFVSCGEGLVIEQNIKGTI